jgi:hypothetical protein
MRAQIGGGSFSTGATLSPFHPTGPLGPEGALLEISGGPAAENIVANFGWLGA